MIRAVFFDFNGVIVDDEPVHFRLFQEVLKEQGVELSRENYYSKYLGMDDEDCFRSAARDAGHPVDDEKVAEWIQKKAAYYQQEMSGSIPLVPGASEFIKSLAKTHYLAVVSGAIRPEIEAILIRAGVRDCFNLVIAAEDVGQGKPNPEGYEKAMLQLNRDAVASSEMLLPQECLVIEDSIWGIQAAQAADMPCIALTTSFPEAELPGAKMYFKDFSKLDPQQILEAFL
jgi:haloacid dehalogenase superfamily, subfamily IA, variant 3 with third motif having DD or ED